MINIKLSARVIFRHTKPLLASLSPLLLGITLVFIAKQSPTATEAIYSQKLYPIIAAPLATISSFVAFSLAELLLYGAVLVSTGFVLCLLRLGLSRQSNCPQALYLLLLKGIFAASCVFLIFCITTAPNYHRLTFSQQSQLKIKDATLEELVALCQELIQEANQNILLIQRDAKGQMQLDPLPTKSAREEFNRLSTSYTFIPRVRSIPKPVGASYLMSKLKLTGFYFPYTMEANFNRHMPSYDIPTTMCHELAHTAGFMREDEANFLAYITCRGSDLAEFRYSASIMGITYAMNALYRDNPEEFNRLYALYDPQLAKDLRVINAYWKQFDTPIAQVSDTVNHAYLKLNKQSDGTKSYGRVLDLMLADYRSRHKLD